MGPWKLVWQALFAYVGEYLKLYYKAGLVAYSHRHVYNAPSFTRPRVTHEPFTTTSEKHTRVFYRGLRLRVEREYASSVE